MKERISAFEKTEKKTEEIPKYIPKKININEILGKMKLNEEQNQHNRRLSFGIEGFYSNCNIKERLSKLNSTINEEKDEKKENFVPKKIDMRRHSEIMRMSLKTTNIPKEVTEIKKFNIEELMNNMIKENNIKFKHEEFLKNNNLTFY